MNNSNPLVTRGPWNCGGMSGHGIGGYEMQPFRMIDERCGSQFAGSKFRILRGQLYGKRVPLTDTGREEANRLELLYGYAQRYSRNTCRFVMSRAARRRGFGSCDASYNRKANQWEGFCKRYHNGNPHLIGKYVVLARDADYYVQRGRNGCNWIAEIALATHFDYVGEALAYAGILQERGAPAKVAKIVG